MIHAVYISSVLGGLFLQTYKKRQSVIDLSWAYRVLARGSICSIVNGKFINWKIKLEKYDVLRVSVIIVLAFVNFMQESPPPDDAVGLRPHGKQPQRPFFST
jgi:hypothetical protein